jgi:hypothetical protein
MVKLVEKRSVQCLAVKLPQDGNQHRLQCHKQHKVQAAQHIERQQTSIFSHNKPSSIDKIITRRGA